MPDLFHVALLAANTALLCGTALLHARTKYHANLARTAANLARGDRSDARRFAERAEAAAADAPVILPFESAPVLAPQPAAPKLFAPGGPRDADEYVGA